MKINGKSFTLKNLIFKTYMLGVGGGGGWLCQNTLNLPIKLDKSHLRLIN